MKVDREIEDEVCISYMGRIPGPIGLDPFTISAVGKKTYYKQDFPKTTTI